MAMYVLLLFCILFLMQCARHPHIQKLFESVLKDGRTFIDSSECKDMHFFRTMQDFSEFLVLKCMILQHGVNGNSCQFEIDLQFCVLVMPSHELRCKAAASPISIYFARKFVCYSVNSRLVSQRKTPA